MAKKLPARAATKAKAAPVKEAPAKRGRKPKTEEVANDNADTKKGKKDKPRIDMTAFYAKQLDAMEKRFNLVSAELQIPDRLSYGMLMQDYIAGGGMVAGTMIQISGIEKGAKSTTCMTALASALRSSVPIIQYWDAENALLDPRYAEAILRRSIGKIFFGPEKVGRLYNEAVLEDFYNGSKSIMRSLPDKIYRSDRKAWFFVFDSNKEGRALMDAAGFTQNSYDKDLYKETNRLWCQTDVGGLQGLIFCDSYPALITTDEDESDDDKNAMALNARAFSKNIKKVKGVLKRKGFIVTGVNQIRLKPGFNMGNPEYEPGGEALKFYSDQRFQNRPRAVPSGWDEGRKDDGGKTTEFGQEKSWFGKGPDKYNYIYIKNTKNKVGTPLLGTWARVWFTDGEGRPHGFDPVFDTFSYLKITGRISGKRKEKKGFKIMIDNPEIQGRRFTWHEFKLLILAHYYPKRKVTVEGKKGKEEVRLLMEYARDFFNFKKGVPDIRADFFKEIKSGKAYELVNNQIAGASDEEDEDLEA